MTVLPKTRAALKKNMDERARNLGNARAAETKTRTRQIALAAQETASGALTEIDFDNLDQLNRIKGKLKNEYMDSISAAKITSATMLGTMLTLAGTDASSNKTSLVMVGDALIRINDGTVDRYRLSNSGMELASGSEGSVPSNEVGRGISMIGASGLRIWPYDNSSQRGWQMRADGIAGGRNGRLTYVATRSSVSVPTDMASYAHLLVSSSAVLAGNAGVAIRNALAVTGPGSVSGTFSVGGATDFDGAVYFNAGISRRASNPLQINSAVDINIGDLLFTNPSAQAIRGLLGTGLDFYTPNSRTRFRDSVYMYQGLTVVGGVSFPNDSIDNLMLRSHPTDNSQRSVGPNHIFDSLRSPVQGDHGLLRIANTLGGNARSVPASDHSHGSGNTMDFDMLPGPERRRFLTQTLLLRRNLQRETDETVPVSRAEYRRLASIVATLAHILRDAPDLDGFERERMRKSETMKYEDRFFEWRNGGEEDDRFIHDREHPLYESPHPDLVA